jgi:hypothetical protein
MEVGMHPGIYVIFSEYDGANYFLYSTYGNVDGMGFDPSHIKRISTTPPATALEFQPSIVYLNSKFHVYYSHYKFAQSYIYGAHSDDYFQSWVDDGWVANNGSTAQIHPTAKADYDEIFLIWSDYINDVTAKGDLYIGRDPDGITFADIKNISSFHDLTDETYASSSINIYHLAIAYLAQPEGSTTNYARIKILNTYYDAMFDHRFEDGTGTNLIHTNPTVCHATNGRYTVSYGSYNTVTHALDAIVTEFVQGNDMSEAYENRILKESVGTVDPDSYGSELYPVIACYKPLPNAVENFIAFRDYTNGSYQSTNLPFETFGNIRVVYAITESEYGIF